MSRSNSILLDNHEVRLRAEPMLGYQTRLSNRLIWMCLIFWVDGWGEHSSLKCDCQAHQHTKQMSNIWSCLSVYMCFILTPAFSHRSLQPTSTLYQAKTTRPLTLSSCFIRDTLRRLILPIVLPTEHAGLLVSPDDLIQPPVEFILGCLKVQIGIPPAVHSVSPQPCTFPRVGTRKLRSKAWSPPDLVAEVRQA
jgi:hypothetical protein